MQLLERRADGSIGAFGSLVRDGTMIADAPREQLREMLNVRWSIISQAVKSREVRCNCIQYYIS